MQFPEPEGYEFIFLQLYPRSLKKNILIFTLVPLDTFKKHSYANILI